MNNNTNINEIIKTTINVEYQTLLGLLEMDFSVLETAIHKIFACEGKVVISGIGKSAIVAQKLVATLNSTGTVATFLHTADALHGDLGILNKNDILLLISKSGDSREIRALVSAVKSIGAYIIAMVSSEKGFLYKNANESIYVPVSKEADVDNLAPTASAIAHMAIGDAIAMSLKELNGFTEEKFAQLHPGGLLGKKLNLRIGELSGKNMKPSVRMEDTMPHIIDEISSKRLGASIVQDHGGNVVGIITDGDIRRTIQAGGDLYSRNAADIMSKNPKTIREDALAVAGLEMMRKHSITQLIVVNSDDKYVGIIHIHDILNEGLDTN